jgi:tetratricopeptide (TPR) repeat protein
MQSRVETNGVVKPDQPADPATVRLWEKRLNVKAAGILLGVSILLGVGVHFLHGYQVHNNAGILLDQAQKAEDEKRLADAVKYLTRYVALVPSNTEARSKYAMLVADDNVAKTPKAKLRAFFALSRAVQLEPDNRDVRRRLVEVAMHPWLQRFADAAEHLEQLPREGELLGLRARCLEENTKYLDARGLYEEAIAAAPHKLENYVRLADLLRDKPMQVRRKSHETPKKLETAEELAQAAKDTIAAMLKANPKDYRAYLISASQRRRATVLPGAQAQLDADIESDIQKAWELKPDAVDVILALGDIRHEKHPDEVRRLLCDSIAKHPKEEWRLVQALAQLELQEGRPDAAMECLSRGLDKSPDQMDLLWYYANLLILQQKPAEAKIRRLGELGMQHAELEYLKARILCNQEEWVDAAQMLERVYPQFLRSYDERKHWFAFNLALECNLLLGTCYQMMGDPYRAAMAYDRVVTREPRSLPGRLGLARMKWALGQLDISEQEYRRAASLYKAPSAAWIELAQVIIARNLLNEHPNWKAVDDVLKAADKLPWAKQPSEKTALALLRAEALVAQKDEESYEAARNGLQNAKDDKGARPVEAWVGLAGLAMHRGQTDTALGLLDEATRKLGDLVELRVARARYWARKGGAKEYRDQAYKALAPLGKNLPKTYDTAQRLRLRRALAEAYSVLRHYKESVDLWQTIAELRRTDLASRMMLFDLALVGDDKLKIAEQIAAMDEQIAAIKKLEGEAEGTLWRYCRACQCIWQAEKKIDNKHRAQHLAEAADLLKMVADRRPGWARVALAQGQLQDQLGQPGLAVADYMRAVRLGEQRPAVLQQLLRVLTARRNQPGGESAIAAAAMLVSKLKVQSPGLLQDLKRPEAEVALFNHDSEQAVKLALEAVRNDSTGKVSTDYRDHIWLGQMLWAAGQGDQAEASLQLALKLADQVPDTWVALARHFIRADKKKAAEDILEQAVEKLLEQVDKKLSKDQPLDALAQKLAKDQGLLALAKCYQMVGNNDRARAIYEAACKAAPKDGRVLYAMAEFCAHTRQSKKAREYLKRIQLPGVESADDVRVRANRLLAVLTSTGGDYQKLQEALAMLDNADGGGTRSAEDQLANQRARVVLLANQASARKRREAINILEDLRRKQAASLDERFVLAKLYESVGDWLNTRSHLAALLTATADRINRTDGAKEKASLQSANAGYMAYYAFQLTRHDELGEAQSWLAKLEALEPDAVRTVEVKARVLGKQGKGADAVPLLRPIAQRDDRLLVAVAVLLEEIGQPAVAREMFEKYAAKTTEPERLLTLAAFLGRQDRPAEALDLCERAWQTCKPEQVANTSVSILYLAKSGTAHCSRVASRIDEAIAAHPGQPELEVALSAVRRLQGRVDDALTLLRKVSDRNKGDAMVLNNIAWLLALQGKADEALTAIKGAMVMRGEQANLLDTRAVAYIAQRKYKLAIDDLQEAITETPTPTRYFHLARAQLGVGNQAAARDALEHGRNLGLTEASIDPLERPAYQQLLAKLDRR